MQNRSKKNKRMVIIICSLILLVLLIIFLPRAINYLQQGKYASYSDGISVEIKNNTDISLSELSFSLETTGEDERVQVFTLDEIEKGKSHAFDTKKVPTEDSNLIAKFKANGKTYEKLLPYVPSNVGKYVTEIDVKKITDSEVIISVDGFDGHNKINEENY